MNRVVITGALSLLVTACAHDTGTSAVTDDAGEARVVDQALVAQGKREFIRCVACHSVDADGRAISGPHLEGIIGRQFGDVEGWQFPQHLSEHDFVWTESRMDNWLQDPQAMVDTMCLPFTGLSSEQARAALIAYMKNPE
ncbi:cytochrome C [Aliidiomarina sedimenti]|uniref:Cytochrome C n=1 Tax=Aliidiomarina sedimenti TaxID=1933879 RepID=A0ABY0BXQ7_9GAMM|nr:c-type cytochrome [Aliidiomarina sedimenti]RUO29255.1 cytochrome C [Aliidiomarina sedimenti]